MKRKAGTYMSDSSAVPSTESSTPLPQSTVELDHTNDPLFELLIQAFEQMDKRGLLLEFRSSILYQCFSAMLKVSISFSH